MLKKDPVQRRSASSGGSKATATRARSAAKQGTAAERKSQTRKPRSAATSKAPARAQANNAKAETLLGQIIEIVRDQGLAGFSLDNLAPQLGTSSRMLVYYFGGKDELLGRIVHAVRDDIVTQLESEPVGTITEAIDRWWGHYAENPTDMQFFFHLTSRSFEEPEKFREFSSTAVGQWVHYFRRSLEGQVTDAEADAIARLVLATVRGLMGDLLITSDQREAEKSLSIFKEMVQTRVAASASAKRVRRAAPRKRA